MYNYTEQYFQSKDGIFYFVRRVPVDVQPYYSSKRISVSRVTIQSLRSDVIITIAEFLNGRKFVIGNQMLDVWPKAYRLIT